MDNAPLGLMSKQEFLKVLYLDLFFLIYINHLSDNLTSNPKLFSDGTSLFSTVTDPNDTANQINNDLHNINLWAYQWKMNFNPYTSKQAQEVTFSCKIKFTANRQLVFSNYPVPETSAQKHHGIFFNFKLSFQENFENMLNKIYKTIGLLQKLQNTLTRISLLTIYKSFIKPHLDYGNIIYDQA